LAYINYITQALPKYKHLQKNIGEYMQSAYQIPDDVRGKVAAMYSRCGIEYRYSCLPDFDTTISPILFNENKVSMQKRMAQYMQCALPLCIDACNKIPENIQDCTHLITVSCTGMSAPGLDVLLVKNLNLNKDIVRTSINFMGCYAFTHALKIADAFCKSDINAKVMIVLVELCTLHFQQEYSMENMATSMLFADGCSAVWVSNNSQNSSLEIIKNYGQIHGDSESDMSWNITDEGFKMTLSAYVPDIIAANIEPLLNNALQNCGLQKHEIKHWALHPGGKKIIQEIQKALQLQDDEVAISKSVLQQFGNMSSVTLPIVIQQFLPTVTTGDFIFACAFGPGLTLESIVLKAC
jgi:predicted naringenin-chalcone synthase